MSCYHLAVNVEHISRMLLQAKLISNLIANHSNGYKDLLDRER
jgi:hypothetical protein